jgi:hypothetical protein
MRNYIGRQLPRLPAERMGRIHYAGMDNIDLGG